MDKKSLQKIGNLAAIVAAIFFICTLKISAGEASHPKGDYNPTPTIMHHIADANEFHVAGDFSIPLPVILYSAEEGLKFFLSSKFEHGKKAVDGYILDHGSVKAVKDANFPQGEVDVDVAHGKVIYNGQEYETVPKSNLMEQSSFYDFSITKNVFSLILGSLITLFIFLTVARAYKSRKDKAPKGIQSFFEPLILFVRDEVVRPNLGAKTDKFLPYILSVFFFIWILNMLGQIPIFPGSANVSGNIAVTLALALFTFILTTINGNKHYWKHIFLPPVPWAIWPLMVVIEVVGLFIKPIALMIRLFANISAGHIIVLSLVSLIFVFGNAGESLGGSVAGMFVAVPFVIFIGLIELLVAFLQAFIFAMLSAVFIGMAVEEHH